MNEMLKKYKKQKTNSIFKDESNNNDKSKE